LWQKRNSRTQLSGEMTISRDDGRVRMGKSLRGLHIVFNGYVRH